MPTTTENNNVDEEEYTQQSHHTLKLKSAEIMTPVIAAKTIAHRKMNVRVAVQPVSNQFTSF